MLHGGKVSSVEPTAALQPAVLRLTLLAWAIRRRLAPQGIAVARLRFSVRGWNGPAESPVADANWALQQLRDRFDAPIVIAGHSMGGRTAVRVAGEPGVAGVIGLAPWLPPNESVHPLLGRKLVIAHGTDDRIIDPALSASFAERATAVARDVNLKFVPDDGHAMLRKAGLWHRLTAGHAREMLGQYASGILR